MVSITSMLQCLPHEAGLEIYSIFVCSMVCLQRKMKNISWNPFGIWRETSQLLDIIILYTRGLLLIEPIKITIVEFPVNFGKQCIKLNNEYVRPRINLLASWVQVLNVILRWTTTIIQLFIFYRSKVCQSTSVVVEIKFVAVSKRNQQGEIPSEKRK